MAAKKVRKRSPHPGVVLIKPEGRHGWRARYVDPDTQKFVKPALPDDHTTAEQRRQWAIDKSKEIAKRAMELDAGAVRATGKTLEAALDEYLSNHSHLADRTLYIAKVTKRKLLDFAKKHKVTSCDEVTRPFILRFKTSLINEPKRQSKAGGKRKEYVETETKRSPVSVNQDIVSAKAILNHLCDLDVFPKLTRDDIRRALKLVDEPEEHTEFHTPEELKTLLTATMEHDNETFELTRDEAKGKGLAGTTPKFPAIAPFTLFTLLSGCRKAEALKVDWSIIHLDAKDHHGAKVGEMKISGTGTKTKKKRTVGLEVSPLLRTLLVTLHKKAGKPRSGPVFPLTADAIEAAMVRLKDKPYNAPSNAGWQILRSTCESYLVNAPGIYGAASAYRAAKQLGHSVAIAEKHYLGVVRGIPAAAKTLEKAMGIEDLAKKIIEAVRN